MPKKAVVRNRDGLIIGAEDVRKNILQHYRDKFFNKFLNKFEFDGLSYQQIAYIMRKFWSEAYGTIACFNNPVWTDVLREDEKIIFAPWALNGLINYYDFPNKLLIINTRGIKYFPTKPLEIDKDCVIGYIQRNKKGVYASIEAKVEQLVDVEMTIRTNLKSQKMPWIIGVSPENEDKMKKIIDNLNEDEPTLFIDLGEDLKNAKALVSGAPFTLDKLFNLKMCIESEILTLLGIDNLGVLEKKEHLTTGEMEQNNEQIESSSDEFLTCLEEFFDRIEKTLGYKISVKLKENPKIPEYKEIEEEENKDE